MRIKFSKHFAKQFDKAPDHIRSAFEKRLEIFVENQHHPILLNHSLRGEYREYRSINITGDWRALYREESKDEIILFDMIGTHSELYR